MFKDSSAGPVDPESNRQYSRFDQLNPQWWDLLARLTNSGEALPEHVRLVGNELEIPWFNRRLRLNPAERNLYFQPLTSASPSWQEGLVIMVLFKYLAAHRRLPPPSALGNENHLSGGPTFFRGPHLSASTLIARRFSAAGAQMLKQGELWGGRPACYGEFSLSFEVFPGLDWQVVLWEADAEFSARAQYLFDKGLEKVFPLDVIWALGNVIAAKLMNAG
ncbi:MAG: DUF3786 domain-containing protein [Deltaproteobacteria bacterium]|nr:DUF3786 domain-containing protein [Deltaproteobacteria bacterium]